MMTMRVAIMVGCVLGVLLAGCGQEDRITTRSADARSAYEEGLRQLQLFYYPEAKRSFETALAADSGFALAWARLGELDMNTRNERAAKTNLERAWALGQTATLYEQLFIRMQLYRATYDIASAARCADSLIALYPEEHEPYWVRGILFEGGKDLESALRMYQRSVEVDTGFALGVMQLGYIYSALGKTEEAIAHMQHYVQMAPRAADPHASYGDLLLRVGRYDEALQQYRTSLEMKPDYWYAFEQIGKICLAQGRLKESRPLFEQASRVFSSPERVERYLHLIDGGIEYARGDYAKTLGHSRYLLEEDSSNVEAMFQSVRALVRLKRTTEAGVLLDRLHREYARRGLLAGEAMVGYYLGRALVLNEEGNVEEALNQCSKALESSTPISRAPVYNMIARIRLGTREWDAAIDAIEEALKVNPNQPDPLMTLTKIYHGMGDKEMTKIIGTRLLDFWKNADADFQPLKELRLLLGRRPPA